MPNITFASDDIKFVLKEKTKKKDWLKKSIAAEKKKLGDINYIFCSDNYLLDLNIKHLNHNTLTDIITFDYSEEDTLNSDIFISVERVAENAKKFEVDFENELLRVMIHGVLHLCGYKDKKKEDAEKMRLKENFYIKKHLA
ncbi:MAG: rRNA maturation RNase YbeY [Bacteroidota bacterium]